MKRTVMVSMFISGCCEIEETEDLATGKIESLNIMVDSNKIEELCTGVIFPATPTDEFRREGIIKTVGLAFINYVLKRANAPQVEVVNMPRGEA